MSILDGAKGFISNIGTILLILIPVVLIFISIYMVYRDKTIFTWKVRLYQVRENGTVKERNYKAGFIQGGKIFRIKTSKWNSRRKIDLNRSPDPKYVDEENRVYYKQIGVGSHNLMQLKRVFDEDIVKFTPITTNQYYGTILAISDAKNAVTKKSNIAQIAMIAGFVIMAISFLVAFIMLVDKFGGVPVA